MSQHRELHSVASASLPTEAEVRADYDRLHADEAFTSLQHFFTFVRRSLDLRAGHDFLDIGCGTGGFVVSATRAGAKVSGLDISPQAIAKVQPLAPDADLRVGSAEELPWEDGSFDRVASLGLLEHVPDPVKAGREIGRVLRDDGLGFVYVPNTFYWRNIVRAARFGEGPNDEDQIIQRHGARNEWIELLESADLEVCGVRTWRHPWEPAPWRPKAFVGTLIEQLVPSNLLLAFGYLVRRPRRS